MKFPSANGNFEIRVYGLRFVLAVANILLAALQVKGIYRCPLAQSSPSIIFTVMSSNFELFGTVLAENTAKPVGHFC